MGLGIGMSKCSCSCTPTVIVREAAPHEQLPMHRRRRLPNPDPKNFNIIEAYEGQAGTALRVEYPDCTNYEGVKILVFREVRLSRLRKRKTLDPHFCDKGFHVSPFARFEPTDLGWEVACTLCGEPLP